MKGFSSKRIELKVAVIASEKYTFLRRVRASFSPGILHAGAVKGLERRKADSLHKESTGPTSPSRCGVRFLLLQNQTESSGVMKDLILGPHIPGANTVKGR